MEVPPKPEDIPISETFAAIQCLPVMVDKMVLIIDELKCLDQPELHFFRPVDIEILPHYPAIVKKPIHFGQIIERLQSAQYQTLGDVQKDIALLWSNCRLFNGNPDPGDIEMAFANYAANIENALTAYLEQFARKLKERGYLRDPDLNEIGRIIDRLGIKAVCKTQLYKHKSKLELYQKIEVLCDTLSLKEFRTWIADQGSDKVRDFKNGMRVSGPIVPKAAMVATVVDKFKEIKKRMKPKRAKQTVAATKAATNSSTIHDGEDQDVDMASVSPMDPDGQQCAKCGHASVGRRVVVCSRSGCKRRFHFDCIRIGTSVAEWVCDLCDGKNMSNAAVPGQSSVSNGRHRKQPGDGNESEDSTSPIARSRRSNRTISDEDSSSDEQMLDADNGNGNTNSHSNSHPTAGGADGVDPNAPIRPRKSRTGRKSTTHSVQNGPRPSRTLGRVQYLCDSEGTKVRSGLDCPYPRCSASLHLLTAIHRDCLGGRSAMKCTHCQSNLSDLAMMYYHCIEGCQQRVTDLERSHMYFLCERCADQHCNSPQKYLPIADGAPSNHSNHNHNGNSNTNPQSPRQMAFHGVWTSFRDGGKQCEIMVMLQESNRVSWQFQTDNIYENRQKETMHGSIEEVNGRHGAVMKLKVDDTADSNHNAASKHTQALLRVRSARDITLIFGRHSVYHKALPRCTTCDCDMQFMLKGTVPNRSVTQVKCGTTTQQDLTQYATTRAMHCNSFCENITKQWYFHCGKCHAFSLCAACAMIGHENEIKQRRREQREEKRRSARNGRNGRKRSFTEMNGKGNDDEVSMLRRELIQVKKERDQWKRHYEKLTKLLDNAAEYHKAVIKRS